MSAIGFRSFLLNFMLLLHLLLPSIPTVSSQQFGLTASTPSNESKECMELANYRDCPVFTQCCMRKCPQGGGNHRCMALFGQIDRDQSRCDCPVTQPSNQAQPWPFASPQNSPFFQPASSSQPQWPSSFQLPSSSPPPSFQNFPPSSLTSSQWPPSPSSGSQWPSPPSSSAQWPSPSASSSSNWPSSSSSKWPSSSSSSSIWPSSSSSSQPNASFQPSQWPSSSSSSSNWPSSFPHPNSSVLAQSPSGQSSQWPSSFSSFQSNGQAQQQQQASQSAQWPSSYPNKPNGSSNILFPSSASSFSSSPQWPASSFQSSQSANQFQRPPPVDPSNLRSQFQSGRGGGGGQMAASSAAGLQRIGHGSHHQSWWSDFGRKADFVGGIMLLIVVDTLLLSLTL